MASNERLERRLSLTIGEICVGGIAQWQMLYYGLKFFWLV